MLLEKDNVTRKHIDNYFYNQGVNIKPDIEASNMDFLIECARMGLGITSVIKTFVKPDLDNGSLIEITLENPISIRHIGIASKKNINHSFASTSLIHFLLTDQ